MALGNLRSIGGVAIEYRNPDLQWTADPTENGVQPCTIAGTVEIADGHTLREMVNTPAARTTLYGHRGVLEWLLMDGDSLAPLTGYYLLQRFVMNVDRQFVYGGRVAFTLTAAYLGGLS